jgi:hypothetical protein
MSAKTNSAPRTLTVFGLVLPMRGLAALVGGCLMMISFAADFSWGKPLIFNCLITDS